jgi:hypothetical protein
MREHNFPHNTFIGGWYISEKICDRIIEYFNNNRSEHYLGLVGSVNKKIDETKKQSIDMAIDPVKFVHIFKDYHNEFLQCLDLYIKKYNECANNMCGFGFKRKISIQHYKKNGGFKVWHKENDGQPEVITRHLVFMTYLNDVEDGGTDFLYQNLTTPAKKGLTLIWPAGWTHTHKGQISSTSEKYILTSWIDFV